MPEIGEAILAACRDLVAAGLVSGTAGNVSRREGERIWITPSGMPYRELVPADLVCMDLDGRVVEGVKRPSVELPMHLAAYRADPAARAVVHTHPVHVMALAMLGWSLPPVLDSLAGRFGGPVPVLDYAPSASQKLAALVGGAAPSHPAMILKNHGLVVTGSSLRAAVETTLLVENSAAAYLLARQFGDVESLPPDVVAARHAFVRSSYGQKPAATSTS